MLYRQRLAALLILWKSGMSVVCKETKVGRDEGKKYSSARQKCHCRSRERSQKRKGLHTVKLQFNNLILFLCHSFIFRAWRRFCRLKRIFWKWIQLMSCSLTVFRPFPLCTWTVIQKILNSSHSYLNHLINIYSPLPVLPWPTGTWAGVLWGYPEHQIFLVLWVLSEWGLSWQTL